MVEWASFTFVVSNYRRNHTQHRREYVDNRKRRTVYLLQYIVRIRGLETILIVEETTSNTFCMKTLDLAERRSSIVKGRYQRRKDMIFTQNESFSEDIEDIQRTQVVKAGSKLVNFNPYLDKQGTLRSHGRLQKAPINFNE